MTLTVAFRVDASLDIGSGHVIRCLTLAEALRARAAACHFVMRTQEGHLVDMVRDRGFRVSPLGFEAQGGKGLPSQPALAHAAWLGCDWQVDAQHTLAALGPAPVDWLIVDHYALDARWEQALSSASRRLMVIDDLADRRHCCSLLLDQNLGRERNDYRALVPADCTLLIGPSHALLRPEFAALRPASLQRRSRPRLLHLLVSMGGVDRDNATGRVLEALRHSAVPPTCRVTVVMGRNAPWLQSVQAQAEGMPWHCEVRVGIADMAQLMSESDLAIGAAGGSAWERCSVGLPCLLLVLADNQRAGARALAEAGAALLLPGTTDLTANLKAHLAALQRDDSLSALVQAASNITDGKGVERVLQHLVEPALD